MPSGRGGGSHRVLLNEASRGALRLHGAHSSIRYARRAAVASSQDRGAGSGSGASVQGIWRMLAHLAGARVPARCFSSLISLISWSAKTTEHASGIALASALRSSSRLIETYRVGRGLPANACIWWCADLMI